MHNLQFIRENPEAFNEALKKRGLAPSAAQILSLDEKVRSGKTNLQNLQTRKNEIAREIPILKKNGGDISALLKEAEDIKKNQPAIESELAVAEEELTNILVSIPNILVAEVPFGKDETENLEVRVVGEKTSFNFEPKEHFDLGESLEMMDFEQAALISGSRFVLLKSDLARLERALAMYMLDHNISEYGYTEISAPVLVKSNAVFGVGQLPKFEEDLFKTTNDYYLISTSEVVLTNLVAEKIIAEEKLPLRYTAYTPCFRSEAGSAGRDTRGMIRLHQFNKVEMVSIIEPEKSNEEHERMLSCAESLLKNLGIPFRTMLLCSGDTGFQSQKTYDIELWLPGQKKYREISSCSNCGDFQARRINARLKRLTSGKNEFVHTLNGSGLPTGRTLVAILENYQNEDGTISIPSVLQKYMGMKTKIG